MRNNTIGIEKASIPCNLCGSQDVSILAGRSRMGAALRTVICPCCGLVWSDPFPHEPRYFYESEYRLDYKKIRAPKAKHVFRAGKVAVNRLGKIRHLLTGRLTILDVGSGGGEFAYLLKSLGHDLYGVEPNKGYAEYSAAEYGLNLQIGFIQDADFGGQFFDVVTIWHVLEHTEDPCRVLATLHALLKPDGVLVVEVPNVEAVCQTPGCQFHEAHLFNFNLATLAGLGEKAGFSVDRYLFSEDGGNITAFFRKAQTAAIKATGLGIDGNAGRIIALIRGHSRLRYYLGLTPYRRFFLRLYGMAAEKIGICGYDNSKNLLDKLYRSHMPADKA